MKRRQRNLPILEKIEIIDLAAEGKAIAKVQLGETEKRDFVVFVERCVPGDVVDIKVTNRSKNFMEGFPLKFHKLSDLRIDAKCSHFGLCGGCKWQSLPYKLQLQYKQKQVTDQLTHIGKIDLPEPETILASEKEYYYRNKLEYTFTNKRWLYQDEIATEKPLDLNALGYHIPGKFDKIFNVEHCYLQNDPSNAIRLAVNEFAKDHGFEFFDLKEKKGLLRNLTIRTTSIGEVMVIVSFFYDDKEKHTTLMDYLVTKFPEINSLMYVINPKGNDTINDLDVKLFNGKDHIFEEMEGLRFKIGPKSFYQTNSEQAYRLYCIAREYADLQGNEIVYDLYTGTGTIANFIAKNAAKVIGIEYIPEAIEDAKVNSEINKIENTAFFAGDMKDILNKEFFDTNGHPDVIILDPPRAGVHKNVIDAILQTKAQKIVYVSCNAATQARDIQLLSTDYKVVKYRPVDMFPQTAHVENVALLERR